MRWLRPLFDALDTLARTPGTVTPASGPHVRDVLDLKRTMATVVVALLPALAFAVYTHGAARMLPIVVVSYGVGLGIEIFVAALRKTVVNEGYFVTGMLIALIVPVTIPLWQLAIGVAFAVVFGKEVFGGTGQNIFNPALVCRAFLFFAYPAQMTGDVWGGDPATAAVQVDAVTQTTPGALTGTPWVEVDAVTQATPLALAAFSGPGQADGALQDAGYSTLALFLGEIPGTPGEVSKVAILLGALVLVIAGIGSLRIMVSAVVGLLVTATVVWLVQPDAAGLGSLTPWQHLLLGGFLFGVVFMMTDPVTSPETSTGRVIFGLLCGALTVLVRVFNPAYPEGTMLAILLMNAFAPAIDRGVLAVNVRRRRARLG